MKTELNYDMCKMGHILLVKKTKYDLFSNLIFERQLLAGYKKEHAEYTHVEILGGGPDSIRIAPPMSKMIDIFKTYKGRYVKILKLKDPMFPNYDEQKRYKIAYFAASLCNTGYDVPGIFRFIFKWIKTHNRLWFCSEGASWSIKKVYPVFLENYEKDDVMPCMFSSNISQTDHVWEGIIN